MQIATGWLHRHWPAVVVGFSLLAAAGFKFALVALGRVPFNADEAVVALMARHILQGERPIFFYGQAYMGSLDAFLVAAGFRIFGEQVWVIRLVQALLYLGTLITTAALGQRAFASRRVGALAVLLLAIPTVNVSLYTTASLGGYGEALLLGNLILLACLQIDQSWRAGRSANLWVAAGLWGFLSGLGLWAFGLTLIYSLPTGLFLMLILVPLAVQQCKLRRLFATLALMVTGFLVGASPWIVYAGQHGLQPLVFELGGSAIAGAESGSYFLRFLQHLMGLLFGITATFGMRPPWEMRWLGLPLLPLALSFWVAICVWMVRKALRRGLPHGQLILLGVVSTLLAGFLFTSFGADPSGRYFVPLAVPLALFAANWILVVARHRQPRAFALILLVVGFQLWGNLQAAVVNPLGLTTQFYTPSQIDHRYDAQLIRFLNSHNETTGYSNYWVAYPLAFLSEENLIFTPRLPYHTDLIYTQRDDRYPDYDRIVAQAQHVAYITTKNPALDNYLREKFQALQISWEEQQIGDYRVYYHLSRAIRPGEINLLTMTKN